MSDVNDYANYQENSRFYSMAEPNEQDHDVPVHESVRDEQTLASDEILLRNDSHRTHYAAVVHIGSTMPEGIHPVTIGTLGEREESGLVYSAFAEFSLTHPPKVRLFAFIKDHQRRRQIAEICFAIDEDSEIEINDYIDLEDHHDDLVDQFPPMKAMDLDLVPKGDLDCTKNGNGGRTGDLGDSFDYTKGEKDRSELPNPSEDGYYDILRLLRHSDRQLLQISFFSTPSQVTLLKTSFWQTAHKEPPGYQRLVDSIQSIIDKLKSHSELIVLTVDAGDHWRRDWWPIAHSKHIYAPYSSLMKSVPERFKMLKGDDINLDVERPQETQAKFTFKDSHERNIAGMFSAADEIRFEDHKLKICASLTLNIRLVVLQSWEASANDLSTFGMKADGTPLTVLAFIRSGKNVRTMMQNIKSPVKVYMNTPMEYRQLPFPPQSKIGDMASAILSILQNAYNLQRQHTKAYLDNARAEFQANHNSRFQESDRYISALQEAGDAGRCQYDRTATPPLLDWVDMNAEVPEWAVNKPPSVQTFILARQLAWELHPHQYEHPQIHLRAIRAHLRRVAPNRRPPPMPVYGEPFTGVRVDNIPGQPENYTAFLLDVPHQSNWPRHLKSPPVGFKNLCTIEPVGGIQAFFRQLVSEPRFVTGFITYRPDTRGLVDETNSYFSLHNEVYFSSHIHSWFDWTVQFQNFKGVYMNMLTAFPSLESRLKHTGFNAEIISHFRMMRCGKMFVSGPGQSRLVMAVATTVIYEKQTAEAHEVLRLPVCESLLEKDSLSRISPNVKYAAAKSWAEKQANSGAPGWRERPPKRLIQDNERIAKNRVAWSAPTNEQCYGALKHAVASIQGIRCLHVYPYEKELQALLRPQAPELSPLRVYTGDESALMNLRKHCNEFNRRKYNERNFLSWSSIARRIAVANPKTYASVHRAWNDRRGKDIPPQTMAAYRAGAKRLLRDVLNLSSVICGTPHSLRQLANRFDWEPSLLVMDHSDQMPETQTTVIMSKWCNCYTLIVGDETQLAPDSNNVNESGRGIINYCRLFGPQRRVSLLKRAYHNGEIDIHLDKDEETQGNQISSHIGTIGSDESKDKV